MLFGTMLSGLAETLALGEKVGLQQEQILEILSLLPISSKLNVAKGDGSLATFFHSSDKKQINGVRVAKRFNPVGFIGLNLAFVKRAHLGGFWDFHGFSFTTKPTAR